MKKVLLGMVIAAGAVASLVAPSSASAQLERQPFIRGVRPEVHANVDWWGVFGAGFRVDIPLVSGVFEGIDDELALSPGADVSFLELHDRDSHDGYAHDGFGLYPVVDLQWNVYLGSNVSLFPEAGIGVALYLHDHGNDTVAHAFLFPSFGLGGRLHFNRRNALLVRVNWPTGLQIGLTF